MLQITRQIYKNPIARAYITSLLGVVSGLISNLWVLREITKSVPTDLYGAYAYIYQITSYLALCQLSLDFAASQNISLQLGKMDSEKANDAYWQVVRASKIGASVASGLLLILVFLLWQGVIIKPVFGDSRLLLIAVLTGGTQIIYFLIRPATAALIGTQRQDIVNITILFTTLGTSFLALVLLKLELGILALPISQLLLTVGNLLVNKMWVYHFCWWVRKEKQIYDRTLLKSILSFGGMASLGGLAWTIEATSDVIILGYLDSTTTVGLYVVWWRFPSMVFDVSTRLVTSAFPTFARNHGKSSVQSKGILTKIGYIVIGLATLALLGIGLWLPTFVTVWLQGQYLLENAKIVAYGMAILVYLRIIGNLLGMFWLARGSAILTSTVGCCQALIKVSLGILLFKRFGLIGLIGASCVGAGVQVACIGIALFREKYIQQRLAIIAIGFTTIAIAILAISAKLSFPASVKTLAIGIVATTIVWACLWGGVINKEKVFSKINSLVEA